MIGDQEIRALAFLARRRRPHGAFQWDEPGIIAAIEKVRHLALGEVQDALGRAADDRNARTPGVIVNLASSYWRTEHTDRAPAPTERVNSAELCDVCGKTRLRHAATDHAFLAVGEYLAHTKLPDKDTLRQIATDIKQDIACTTDTEETPDE